MDNIYIYDIFYKTQHLSIDDKKSLLLDAKNLSYYWHIDKIPEDSWSRKNVKYARFNTILKILDDKCHFVFIHRQGFLNYKNKKNKYSHEFCIETGFCTLSGNAQYLFIFLDEKHLEFFEKKYNLTERL